MKIMSRNFTRTEKLLILVLALILVGLVYYRLVDRNVRDSIASSKAESASLDDEMTAALGRLAQLEKMRREVDDIVSGGQAARMESYNNSKEEVVFLNDALSGADDYAVAFKEVTRNGDQIRRAFTLQYKTKDYPAAEIIMSKLCDSPYRCLIGDMSCTIAEDGVTTIRLLATFYETMVGGVPDSGLPADSAATKNG